MLKERHLRIGCASVRWLSVAAFGFVLVLWVAQARSQIVDSFNPNPQTGGNSLDGIAFEPDGSVLAFGIFTTFGGQPRPGLARSSANGALDLNFNPNASYPGGFLDITTVSVQNDRKLLVWCPLNN